MKRIAVTFPEAIGRRMKVAAAQEGVTLSALLVDMFERSQAKALYDEVKAPR